MLLPLERAARFTPSMRFAASSMISPTMTAITDAGRDARALARRTATMYSRGTPTRPVSRALAENVAALQYSAPLFRRGHRGRRDGSDAQRRYESFDELSLYCSRVASAVGLICIEIFGYSQSRDPRLCRETRARVPAHQHHSRCSRRCRARPHLFTTGRSARALASRKTKFCDGVYSRSLSHLMAFEAERARRLLSRGGEARCPPKIVPRCSPPKRCG